MGVFLGIVALMWLTALTRTHLRHARRTAQEIAALKRRLAAFDDEKREALFAETVRRMKEPVAF